MDTTPGGFRWAPAADLAAWSSDTDWEAVPNIRERRPAMDEPQRTQIVASSRSDDWRPGATGTIPTYLHSNFRDGRRRRMYFQLF